MLTIDIWFDASSEDKYLIVFGTTACEAVYTFERIAMYFDYRPFHGEHVQHGRVVHVVRVALHTLLASEATSPNDEEQIRLSKEVHGVLVPRNWLGTRCSRLLPLVDLRPNREAVECWVFVFVVLCLTFHAAEHVDALPRDFIPYEGPQNWRDFIQSQHFALVVGDKAHCIRRDVTGSILRITDLHGLPLVRLQVDLDEVI